MKNAIETIAVVVVLLLVSTDSRAQSNSVLGAINCGGGQATCFQQSTAQQGLVRCTCTANCLANQCITPSVAATRAVQWGANTPCAAPLTGKATGGTTTTNNPSTTTAVFAKTELSGAYIGTRTSKQTADCFLGLVVDEPVIVGIC